MQTQRQIDELLALRASEWMEILPTASPQQMRELEAWLSESRLHVQEFLEVAEVELALRHLDRERQQDVEVLLKRIAPNGRPLARRLRSSPVVAARSALRRRVAAGAAMLCLGLGAVGVTLFHEPPGQHYQTALGEQRIIDLADRSVVTLNADSIIDVSLRTTERGIDLKRGEALFNVAHDASRPFRVRTRAGTVRAVGTAFNVHDRINGDTRVSVLEGRVVASANSGAEVSLGANEEADIHLDGTIQRHANAVVKNAVAWRERRLVFDNASLAELTAEFNRYNRSPHIRLEGLEHDTRRYDGVFEASDPDSLVQLLSREADLAIERRGDEVVIRKR